MPNELFDDPHRVHDDLRIVHRAIRKRWPVPAAVRARIAAMLADKALDEGEETEIRLRAAATLLAADKINIEVTKLDDETATQQHVHFHQASVAQEIADDPEYAEFLRQRALRLDAVPGDVGPLCESRPVEASAAPAGAGPGADSGGNGKHASNGSGNGHANGNGKNGNGKH